MSREAKLYVWAEEGDVYVVEEGDYQPHELGINLDDKNANDALTVELGDFQTMGYIIKVGKPAYMSEVWGAQ